ncbi:MAG: TIGR04255 family protein [Deltaproteobacteria bacterium]|jgi:uncharacterized protein (TIGR04255 family)|nr:TIGR04255 family protein [Deltaproteobacteria bacterium]
MTLDTMKILCVDPDDHPHGDTWKIRPSLQAAVTLGFPEVLAVMARPPVEYQDSIIKQFPVFSLSRDLPLDRMPPVKIPGYVSGADPSHADKNYYFSSADDQWYLNLSVSSLSLGTMKYTTIQDYLERLEDPVRALTKIYRPPFYRSVSFRVLDSICPSLLGLPEVPWDELLKPWVLGLLANPVLAPLVRDYTCSALLNIGSASWARVTGGLVLEPEKEDSRRFNPAFQVDTCLFFQYRQSLDEVLETFRTFYSYANEIFHSIITEKLYNNLILGML